MIYLKLLLSVFYRIIIKQNVLAIYTILLKFSIQIKWMKVNWYWWSCLSYLFKDVIFMIATNF